MGYLSGTSSACDSVIKEVGQNHFLGRVWVGVGGVFFGGGAVEVGVGGVGIGGSGVELLSFYWSNTCSMVAASL